MTDLTDAVQTIISILGNSSTGIGATGYAITKDNDSDTITIAGGEILVTYIMSKEQLKSLFGGTQDYDIIITIRSGEVEDKYIGLSTKVWRQPVIITINIIDKWSAVGADHKYITGHLVREKAVNALRKFIKANETSPGGTINLWKPITYTNEEDVSVKPIIYKCIVVTEAWMYYNP